MITMRFLIICLSIAVKFGGCTICPKYGEGESLLGQPCFEFGEYQFNFTKKIEERHDVEFECYVKNKAAYSVLWMFNNQLISLDGKVIRPDPNIRIETDLIRKFNLHISHVSTQNAGKYKCQISTLTAQDLEYDLDVLIAPTIERSPSQDVITLNQGETLKVQCLTKGNPQPRLTWSKRGVKAEHTTIDENKSELILENVDQTYADFYSCTANNDIGNPVTSEFQVVVKFAPVVKFIEENHVRDSVLYTEIGSKEVIKCQVDAYPKPKITLLHNNLPITSDSYLFRESEPSGKQFLLTYKFTSAIEKTGEYKCVAENEIGVDSSIVNVTPKAGGVTIKLDEKFPSYSDAILFEWSTLSGSPISEVNVQYTDENNANATDKITTTQKQMGDGTLMPPKYIQENIEFKDLYELTGLHPNTTYTIRLRVKNSVDTWSDWSNSIILKTHINRAERKHKPHRHNYYHHARKQHHIDDSSMKYNSYLSGDASFLRTSFGLIIANYIFIRAIFQ